MGETLDGSLYRFSWFSTTIKRLPASLCRRTEIMAQLSMIAARQWESRSESITAESKSLVRRLEAQRSLKLKAIEARIKVNWLRRTLNH